MSLAHMRKKDPEKVRRLLLDCAARLIAEAGLAGLTVQAAAIAAGVTKGGLFHHFPTRQALVDAVFQDILDWLDAAIDSALARDDGSHGCFTRAYIALAFAEPNQDPRNPWSALSIATITDPSLAALWTRWLTDRLVRHRATDTGPTLEIVRLAADGAWLARLHADSALPGTDFSALRARLIALTR